MVKIASLPLKIETLTNASPLPVSIRRFLNSNFWQTYRQHGSPSIEDLLSKDDCTVEKLLDDEDIIQEFKTQNNKLLT